MTECASSHPLARSGEEWAARRAQWGDTTAGRQDKAGFPLPDLRS
jgi:hypothetical protein